MYLAIDGKVLRRQPHEIEIVEPTPELGFTADGFPTVQPKLPFITLNCTWGAGFSQEDVATEIYPYCDAVHMVTYEVRKGVYDTINCWIARPRVTHVGYTQNCKIATSNITVVMTQISLPLHAVPLCTSLFGVLSAINGFTRRKSLMAGTPIDIYGSIRISGAGGPTTINVVNVTQVTTFYTVTFAATTGAISIVATDPMPTFAQGDEIAANVTATPGNSYDALLCMSTLSFKP